MESNHGPLSYQDSVLPLNYTRTQGIMSFVGNERTVSIDISRYQDSVLPLNYTRLRPLGYGDAMHALQYYTYFPYFFNSFLNEDE